MLRYLISFFALLVTLQAEDLYFTQSGSGSHNGTIGNPWSVTEANNPSNWGAGAGKVSPGDTIHVVGTITSNFSPQAGGTSGNPVTILFDSGANFTSPLWPSPYGAISFADLSYITIDGGATGMIGGYGATGTSNGFIQNTANGTGLAHQSDSVGIWMAGSSNIIIKNLVVKNLYVRAQNDPPAGITLASAVHLLYYGGLSSYGNDLVTNCVFSDCGNGFDIDYNTTTNLEYSYCTAYNTNICGWAGNHYNTSTLSGMHVHHCYFHDWKNWDDSIDSSHHDGFFTFCYLPSTGYAQNVTYDHNVIGPGFGANATTGLFIQYQVKDALIYDNLFLVDSSGAPNNGCMYLNSYPSIGGVFRVYNNTAVGVGSGAMIDISGGDTYYVNNNVSSGLTTQVIVQYNASVVYNGTNNFGYGLSGGSQFAWSSTSAGVFYNIAGWQALGAAFDANFNVSNPNLSGTYQPNSGSPVIAAGVNNSAYFTTDLADATWTVPYGAGAYQNTGGGGGGGVSSMPRNNL
jgi:hypothetical protein